MNKYVMFLMLGLTIGCGKQTKKFTVDGKDGSDGKDGYSIVASTESNPELCGDAGGIMVLLALDMNRNLSFDSEDLVQTQYVSCNGTDGSNGLNGQNGLDGVSCSVDKVGDAAIITCGNSSAVVVDGATGHKGDKGDKGDKGENASGIYITEVINPCGVEFANEEVFLRLSTGRILALYDGGPQQDRLALIAPGKYITTDANQNASCSFEVTSDYMIINEVRK